MRTAGITPGFMVVHGNHPEALRDLLVQWMARYPLAPLEDELVLVQSNGIGQWLKLALARDVADGGCGIAAALEPQLPSRFIWQAYRAVLGPEAVPSASPFDKELLVWRLIRLLPALLAEPVFAPLHRFLARDTDLRKRYQLAERLADLFDQYQVYRADWLAGWARGEDTIQTSRQGVQPLPETLRWQPRLWRALLDDVGTAPADHSRAQVHRLFLAAASDPSREQRPRGLPRRLLVFGISSLPQQSLEVLSALARWVQVLMCVHNPCEHYWANIIADKDLLRAERSRQARKAGAPEVIDDALLHAHAHPLLAAWGKQGRDFISLLDVHDERGRYEQRFIDIDQRIDLFEPNGGAGVLQQLQDDILDLRPLAETRTRWPGVDTRTDRSLRFHVAHSAQREVEVLHDQLLEAFHCDPTLRPRDIIVMVPDINTYTPHVQAVFGLVDHADARYIPFTLADQGQRHHDPLLGALEKLLALPQSRLAVSDVLDLLEVPSLRARFDIGDDQLPLLHRWISAANVRWGLHAEQRGSLDLPQAPEQNSWFFGLRRMLLGYAVGAGQEWQGIEPLDEIGGLDAALLGPLVKLLDALDQGWRALREPADPTVWGERLRALLQAFFLADEGVDGFTLMKLETTLQDWQDACAAADLHEALPLSVVREHWLAQMDQAGLGQPFFAGSVTFATLMPMRAIPFRRVCLLGMNDGDYPRPRVPVDFDLMGRDYRPGDRSRREDDRYLFLEALLSAREHLHVSWVGRSIQDNGERPPSVLVAQLRDHLAAGWRLADALVDASAETLPESDADLDDLADPRAQRRAGEALLHALTTEHRLQPFNRDYFAAQPDDGDGLFSHAREWREGLLPQGPQGTDDAAASTSTPGHAPLPLFNWDGTVSLRQVSDFLKDPVSAFFRLRLRIHFEQADPVGEDQEPFAIDALENWQLQHELIQAQRAAIDLGQPREDALQDQLARIERRGELPLGHFADAVRTALAEPMDKMFAEYEQALADWPHASLDEPLDDVHASAFDATPVDIHLVDWLGDLRRNDQGARARVLLESGGLLRQQAYRRDKLIPFWVAHLAGHLAGEPLTTVIVSKNGTARLPPLAIDEARRHWAALLDAWLQGMSRPLPLAVKTGFAWLEKNGHADSTPTGDAARAARDCYEVNEPAFLRFGECAGSAYLSRSHPDFERLWSGGEFARLADALLRPLYVAMGSGRAGKGKGDAA